MPQVVVSNSVKDENQRRNFVLDMLKGPMSVWVGDDVSSAVRSPNVGACRDKECHHQCSKSIKQYYVSSMYSIPYSFLRYRLGYDIKSNTRSFKIALYHEVPLDNNPLLYTTSHPILSPPRVQ